MPHIARTSFALLALSLVTACAAMPRHALVASFAEKPAAPALDHDVFVRDTTGAISQADLDTILAAPVFLEDKARIGVVMVGDRYALESGVPTAGVPGVLARTLQDSGLFEVTTEVSADWPTDGGIAGLREIAARYRAEYLLLYRHRFVSRTYANGWGWTFPTLIGLVVAPARTLETAGVLEATMFDVRTGTILFTVYERVHATEDATLWSPSRKLSDLQLRLLQKGAASLAEQVVQKTRVLAAARPTPPPAAVASPTPTPAPGAGG